MVYITPNIKKTVFPRPTERTEPEKVWLPDNLKDHWPNPKKISSVSFYDLYKFVPDLPVILADLKINKRQKILDIGAFKNEMVETIQNINYVFSRGIDVNPEIEKSLFGEHINFRDVERTEKYSVIYFNQLLAHFSGEELAEKDLPPLWMLANKIFVNMLPKGYLIFSDYAHNSNIFRDCLIRIGFYRDCDYNEFVPSLRDEITISAYQKD